MKTINKLFGIAGLGALTFIAGGLTTLRDFEPKSVIFKDMDKDGKDDIVISTKSGNATYVLLERDGKYVRLTDIPEAERNSIRKTVYDNMANLNGYNLEK